MHLAMSPSAQRRQCGLRSLRPAADSSPGSSDRLRPRSTVESLGRRSDLPRLRQAEADNGDTSAGTARRLDPRRDAVEKYKQIEFRSTYGSSPDFVAFEPPRPWSVLTCSPSPDLSPKGIGIYTCRTALIFPSRWEGRASARSGLVVLPQQYREQVPTHALPARSSRPSQREGEMQAVELCRYQCPRGRGVL